jgi:hypothetical protein
MPLSERNKLAELDPAVSGELTGTLAELVLAIGKLGGRLDKPLSRPRIPWEACHPIGPIGALNLSAGAATLDQPDLLGPHDPYWWDLRRWSAWGFTAGTVSLFKNGATATQLGSLSAPGNVTWSAQELLAPRDRLVIVAAGITGSVQWEVRGIEVESVWLPEYLM